MAERMCVLVDGKICDDCGECKRCDLDPEKICDNCMKCVFGGADYRAIAIDEIIDDGTGAEEFGKNVDRDDDDFILIKRIAARKGIPDGICLFAISMRKRQLLRNDMLENNVQEA